MPSVLSASPEKDTIDISLLTRDFSSLTDIDEIRECLRLLDEVETRIDKSLDGILVQESDLDKSLTTLSKLG
jgi:hypothetical protein